MTALLAALAVSLAIGGAIGVSAERFFFDRKKRP